MLIWSQFPFRKRKGCSFCGSGQPAPPKPPFPGPGPHPGPRPPFPPGPGPHPGPRPPFPPGPGPHPGPWGRRPNSYKSMSAEFPYLSDTEGTEERKNL